MCEALSAAGWYDVVERRAFLLTEPVTTAFEPELHVPAMEVTLWEEEKSVWARVAGASAARASASAEKTNMETRPFGVSRR